MYVLSHNLCVNYFEYFENIGDNAKITDIESCLNLLVHFNILVRLYGSKVFLRQLFKIPRGGGCRGHN